MKRKPKYTFLEKRARMAAYMRTYRKTPRGKYFKHKDHAKQRGIAFLLSFEQWWKLWEPHWDKRGTCQGCYVMARKHDVGPYAKGNVSIVTATQNAADRRIPRGEDHYRASVNMADVLTVRKELAIGKRVAEVARSHGLSRELVQDIKGRRTWAHV
jgi:hypothetical protein